MPKPRGRPRKTLLDRHGTRATVNLTLQEAVQLDLFAAEAGLSVSEYLRSRALDGQKPPALDPVLKHDVCRMLLAVQRGLRDGSPAPVLAEHMQAVIGRLLS